MAEPGWRLGPHWYVPVAQLAFPEGQDGADQGCSWTVVRRDGEGPRCLLQRWDPCPPGQVLDRLRAEFLHRFSRAEAMDPGVCHLGFDEAKAWFLQELVGIPLLRLWDQADRAGRDQLRVRLVEALAETNVPRLLMPEVIGVAPGRILAPRVLGTAPCAWDELLATLENLDRPMGEGNGERPWDSPPDLADGSRLPIRGRMREMTYLKSLMFGLSSAIAMERVLIFQGEPGLGHDRLCDWSAAAAETEGIWVANLELYPEETAGRLLERILTELLGGLEADLYAALPAVARALARRMETYAFLRGGQGQSPRERKLEPEERSAALAALDFAQARHPRMVLVRGLERAAAGIPELLKELALKSRIPWLLSCRGPGGIPELRSCLAALKHGPASATVILNRLEDGPLGEVLADLLRPHELPPGWLAEIEAASLGNPGLLKSMLEMAQVKGAIRWEQGRWVGPPDGTPALEIQEDLVAGILLGRLHRLHSAALATVRYLALADEPLDLATLGRALGLDLDALEEALHAAGSAKLALVADGQARIAGSSVRELAIAEMPAREILRCSQVLLKTLDEKGGRPLLAVRLQAFALDRATALARVLQAIEHERAGPAEAERIVTEALKLAPDSLQEARLWEFMADAWGWAREGDDPGRENPGSTSPRQSALEALDRAIQTLGESWSGWKQEERAARLHRKKSLLEIRLRRLEQAEQSIRMASALLADHPFHPEQPRLRLALGRLHLGRGAQGKGMAALEEGLQLLGQKAAAEGHQDQVALLLDLGRAQGEVAQFQGALGTLDSVSRLAEHGGDRRTQVETLDALGQVWLGMGRPDRTSMCMKEAILLARSLDDPELLAECQLHLGIYRSCQQFLGPALASLESACRRFELMGDDARATQAQAWKARNLAALGDHGLADLLLMRVASAGTDRLTPAERGERVFLEAESAGFTEQWGAARRHYLAAANRFEAAGLVWRDRLARLRCIQAEAQEAAQLPEANLKPAWIRLEQYKGPVEGAGSRWLELEWQRAHALLLSASGGSPAVLSQTLLVWGEVMAGARELKFPALVLEASARSSELLLGLGEKLGARSRIQDALPSFHELWAKLPEAFGPSFLGRKDIHGFRQAAEKAGLSITWPERPDPLADWNPAEGDLPLVAFVRAKS